MSEWLQKLLGVRPEDIPEGAVTSFEFAHLPRGSAALLLSLFVVALIAGVIWVYRREGSASPRAKIILATLRCLVLAGAIVLLLEPVLAIDHVETVDKSTIVLIDESLSMSTRDRYTDPIKRARISNAFGGVEPHRETRITLAGKAIEFSELLTSLARQNSVEVFRFSDGALPVMSIPRLGPAETAPRLETISPEANPRAARGTNLAGSIRQAVDQVGSERVAAIVLISDGRVNLGPPAADIAVFLKNKDLVLHTVAVGEAEPPHNLRALALAGPDRVYRRDPAVFDAKVSARGYRTGTAFFERRYEGGEWELLERRDISFPVPDQEVNLKLTDRPQGEGVVEYRIRLDTDPEEITHRDNEKHFLTTVVDEKALVLLVSGSPSHEYRSIKNVLLRDKTIRLAVFLQSADPAFSQDGNDISLRTLPTEKKELFKYDVILLCDSDATLWPIEWPAMIKEFVMEHRGGLGFIAGNKHTLSMLRGTGGKHIAELLPVVVDDLRADQPGVGIGYGRHWNSPWRMVPEPAGLRHAATRFHSDPRRARAEVWDRLPPFYWNFPVLKEKPGATVLARHEDPREAVEPYGLRPIIAVHRFGGGNVMFVATDETHRWRSVAEPIFERFWVQTVRYLLEGRHAGKRRRFRVYLDREIVDLGDAIPMEAEVFDESFEPVDLDSVKVTITDPNADESEILLEAVPDKPGRYSGSFSPSLEGDYKVDASVTEWRAKTPAATFMVKLPDREMGDVRVDDALLRDLSRRTRGISPPLSEIESLGDPKLIPPATERIVTSGTPIPLWDTWLTVAVLLTLLCAEWILRKKFRMV